MRKPSPGIFWPNGSRLVISIAMQFEAGGQSAQAEGPFPPISSKYKDAITPTWYSYGYKEGIPRLLDLWDRYNIKVTSHMIGKAVEAHPALAKEIVQRGHEAAAHGNTWTPEYSMSAQEEWESYSKNISIIERVTGTRPVGFNAFWMRQTPNTLSILQRLGCIYHIDDLSRDEPSIMNVNGKPFAVVPYTQRNNDIIRFDNPAFTASSFAQELKDEFDVLYAESGTRRRMMSISAHDRIGGTPARVKAYSEFIAYALKHPGVTFMRKDEIAKWALSQPNTPLL